MKYVPLTDRDRSFIADHWNRKLLNGLHEMAGLRHGGFLASYDRFIELAGKDYDEFYKNMLMPKEYIQYRQLGTKPLSNDAPQYYWNKARDAWIEQYGQFDDSERIEFEALIADDEISVEKIASFQSDKARNRWLEGAQGWDNQRHSSVKPLLAG